MKFVKYAVMFLLRIQFMVIPFVIFILYAAFTLSFVELRREFENSITSLFLLTSIYYFLKNYKISYYYYLIMSFVIAIVHYFKIIFYEVYGFKLSKSIIYTILETYSEEASSYLSAYFGVFSWSITLIFIGYSFFIINYFRKEYTKNKLTSNALLTGLFVVGILALSYRGLMYKKYNFIYTLSDSLIAYQQTQQQFNSKLISKTSTAFKGVATVSGAPKTYVVIIGESTTRRHMGLYNYNRNTNPLLSRKREHLMVYDSVVATSAYTIFSLNQILLHKRDYIKVHDHFKDNDVKGSIVQLSNMAGFETYWLSNQRPVGVNETSTSKIASAADITVFVNYEDYDYESYDGKILPELDKILIDTPKHKMIFVHLMGAHWNFKHRYPESFNQFNSISNASGTDVKKETMINEYDNAILYNDFIVNSIIDKVKQNETESYVCYFSDHGVDVYENVDGIQHSDRNPTKAMYEIPFVVWMSESYKTNNKLNYNSNRKYVMSDFIHSFSQLSNIDFEEYDATKSIFSSIYSFEKDKVVNTRLEKILYD